MKAWDSLPAYMKNDAVRPYYDCLKKKKLSLVIKRLFDIAASFFLLLVLSPGFAVIAFFIALDSEGDIFFCQERITQYGRKFKILKFRTMVPDAERRGNLVTAGGDSRITRLGYKLRKYRLDELPQLINVFLGDMTFVGTRPEVTKYVKRYTPEMMATLLLPSGITSECSIKYKDEDQLLEAAKHAEEVYIRQILPRKMKYNLGEVKKFSVVRDLRTMIRTVMAVRG